MKYKLPYGCKWHVFTDKDLLDMKHSGRAAEAETLMGLYRQYETNQISFFLAHSGAVPFINDYDHMLTVLNGGNQGGKSFSLLAWFIMRMTKVDPTWPCFTKNNLIVPPEWSGQKRGCLASYRWKHIKNNIWPKLARLLPVDELREYSPWWKPTDGRVRRKSPNFSSGMPCVTLYESESIIDLAAYEQGQTAFESFTWDVFGGDEQMPEGHWRGVRARGLTIDTFQAALAFTPDPIPGQPETGSGTWVHKLLDGRDTSGLVKGVDFEAYSINMWEVPDAIVSDKRKKKWYDESVLAPERSGNKRAISLGRSRFFGTFETTVSIVYDKWNPAVQFIAPFEIPHEWPKMRAFDPGITASEWAGLWAALSPWGDLVLYRNYYRAGMGMARVVEDIIRESGNVVKEIGQWRDDSGVIYPLRREDFVKERYDFSVMDSRTFSSPANDRATTLGDMYAQLGLACNPASGMQNHNALPIIREWFEPVAGRKHILERMGVVAEFLDERGRKPEGTPLLYVFSTLHEFRQEIEVYSLQIGTDDPAPRQRDHLMTALKYLLLEFQRVTPKEKEVHDWKKVKRGLGAMLVDEIQKQHIRRTRRERRKIFSTWGQPECYDMTQMRTGGDDGTTF